MKTHKYSIIFFFGVSMVTLVFLILSAEVWEDFTAVSTLAGIFSSALLSLSISIVNYVLLLKKKVTRLVVGSYMRNADCFGSLFRTNKNMSLEEIQHVLSLFHSKTYELYAESHNILNGMFRFSKKIRNLLLHIEIKLMFQIDALTQMAYYIEYFESDANNNTKKLYNELDALIDDRGVYTKSLELSELLGLGFKYSKSKEDDENYKKAEAEKFRKLLEETIL